MASSAPGRRRREVDGQPGRAVTDRLFDLVLVQATDLLQVEAADVHTGDQAAASAHRAVVAEKNLVATREVVPRDPLFRQALVAREPSEPLRLRGDLLELPAAPLGPLRVGHVADLADPALV